MAIKNKKASAPPQLKSIPHIPGELDDLPVPVLLYFHQQKQYWANLEFQKQFGSLEQQKFYQEPKLHSISNRPLHESLFTLEGKHEGFFIKDIHGHNVCVNALVKKHQDEGYYIILENAQEKFELEQQSIQQALQLNQTLQDLEQKQNALVQSAKLASLGELTSGIAHELNQPLQAILGFSQELMHIEKLSPTGAEFLNDVVNAAHKMKEIINSLRTFSRTSPLTLEPTSVHLCIQEALRLTKHQLHLNNIQYEVQATELDPFAKANAIQLEQVIINLINNAKDALIESHTQQPKILIKVEALNSHINLSIEDNGPGIPLKIKDKIFDAFFTTKEPGKGTGLGLSISHSIIKSFEGTLEVQNAQDSGAQFIISLKPWEDKNEQQ